MKDAFLDLNFLAAWIAPSFPIDIMSFPFEAGCWYCTIPVGTARILRTDRWTSTETPSKCTTQDTGPYGTIPAVSEYTGRFGRKREIRPVQKLKGKIEEMHDLNKPQCSKLPPHWHRRLDLLLPLFFSSSRLLSFSIALISSLFLLNNERCYAVSPSLFCAIWNFLSPFTRD